MNILFVSEYWHPKGRGGGELSGMLLAEALAKRGFHCTVLTSWFDGLDREEIVRGVRILRRLKTGDDPGTFSGNIGRLGFDSSVKSQVEKFCLNEKVDIVHSLNVTSIVGVSKAEISAKKIAHINSPLPFCPKGTKLRYGEECSVKCSFWNYFIPCVIGSEEFGKISASRIKWNVPFLIVAYRRWKNINNSLRLFDFFFPISAYLQSWLIRYDIPLERTLVLPNIVDLKSFTPLKKGEQKIMEKGKNVRVLYIGALLHSKGVDVFVEATKYLKDATCFVYGEGPLQSIVEESHIKFHSSVPYNDIPMIVQSCDILVFPSRVPEAFGRVALEAMSCGKVVVASRVGGIPDIVTEDTGILVNPGSVEELSNALELLVKDKKFRENIGKKALHRARTVFTTKKIVDTCVNVYKSLLQ
ncbi:glycosyltransferase family 4 protein [Candidatus Woesearchaeota archaeon]|nr:glycosyltransferase family 4 protein [Candidatus Woesearchaeota archaeon]